MVCSLAVPAMAANDYVDATIKVMNKEGKLLTTINITEADKITAEKATVEAMLRKADANSTAVAFTFKNGQIAKMNGNDNAGDFKTGKWVVALNGKTISEDLGTVYVNEGDCVVVYLYDSAFSPKFAQYDDSRIAEGIVSFYYYDAKGVKQPLKSATVTLKINGKKLLNALQTNAGVATAATTVVTATDENGIAVTVGVPATYTSVNESGTSFTVTSKDVFGNVITDATSVVTAVTGVTFAEDATNELGLPASVSYVDSFKTDENGNIWIAPQYLSNEDVVITISDISIGKAAEVKKADYSKKGWTEAQWKYYDGNRSKMQFIEGDVIGATITPADSVAVAGATGDMTVAYVMVAIAAVISLGAVVIAKKKAVKAN
jgi:hypothetical protein